MQYCELGDTGLFVSRMSIGALTFGSQSADGMYKAIGGLGQVDVNRMMARAIDAGVNLIDTANVYSEGQSELSVGRALKDLGAKRSDILIATKFFSRSGPGPNDMGGSRAHIMDSVEASLTRLGVDHIDLYQMHGQESVGSDEGVLRALDDLVTQGKIRYFGCSNWQAWKLMKSLAISDQRGFARFQSVQAYYSLAGRDLERELLPLMQDQKVGLLVWGALAWGLLSGKYSREGGAVEGRRFKIDYPPVDRERAWACIDQMRVISKKHGVSVAQVALAWLLGQPHVTSIIIGAKRLEQLDDNLAAQEILLDESDIEALNAVSELPSEYPGWAVDLMSSTRTPVEGQVPAGMAERLKTSAAAAERT